MAKTIPPAYLNNGQEMGNQLMILESDCSRMGGIIRKYKNGERHGNNEIVLPGDFRSFANSDDWGDTVEYIQTNDSPKNKRGYCKMGYA